MAEKEERIFIGFINPEGDACPVPYGKCNSLCDNCKGGMTRTEAINRMAKALYAHTWKSRTPMVRVQNWEIGVTDQNQKRYLGLAEAALNALLEEIK